jgi:SAM-dependent methyltransferase
MAADAPNGENRHFGPSDVRRLYSAYNFLHQRPRTSLFARLAERARAFGAKLRPRQPATNGTSRTILQKSLKRVMAGLGIERPITHILDAGCGAGELAASFARQDPTYSVTGADLTPDHIRVSRERFGAIPNLRFVECDLSNSEALQSNLAVPGGYDVISSIGVLHHLPEPRRGVENLTTLLHREGVLFIYLYDKFARFLAHSLRDVIFAFGEDLSPADRVRLARVVLGYATRKARYRQLRDEDMLAQHDASIADTFCHPLEQIYSVHDAAALLEKAGLDIIGFFDMGGFGSGDPFLAPDRCLGELVESAPASETQWLRELIGGLGGLQKAFVIDSLMDRHSFQGLLVVAAHQGVYPSLNSPDVTLHAKR